MIYLDHSATTPMDPLVIEAVTDAMQNYFANPGTLYKLGLDANKRIEQAQETISRLLKIPSSYRIIFTSGGSESNNLFIKGLCFPDKKVACLGLEHPSVTMTLERFARHGNPPLILRDCIKEGSLDLTDLSILQKERVRLLCLSHVNNELGVINDPVKVASALQKQSSQTRLFIDGVQAIGKLPISKNLWKSVAGYSISAHKFNGPKGIGLLVYDSKINLDPLIDGGKQQYGVRSGTLSVPLIVGLEKALEIAINQIEEQQEKIVQLNRHLIVGLKDIASRSDSLNIRFNSLPIEDVHKQCPAIVNFSFPPVEGEVLLHHLEAKNIYVGLGSACSAHSKEPSRILTGIGLSAEEARCSLRISFGRENTLEDIDRFLTEFSVAYNALFPTFCKQSVK
jgi:cysteine desulfurase